MKFLLNFDKEIEYIYKQTIDLTKANLMINEAYLISGKLIPNKRSLWLKDGYEKDDLSFFWRLLNEVAKGYVMLQFKNSNINILPEEINIPIIFQDKIDF